MWPLRTSGSTRAATVAAPGGATLTSVPAPDPGADEALDAVGAVLRALGRFAFEVDGQDPAAIAESFEAWARHVLVRSPRPGDAPGAGAVERDWTGLRRFVTDHRRREAAAVTAAFSDLREIVWTLVRGMARTVPTDREAERRAHDQLARLKVAAERGTLADLKREALATVSVVEDVVDDRRERQAAQMLELGSRLRTLGHQLEQAQAESARDALTQLANRRAFDQQLDRAADLAVLFGERGCLLLADIDHFKSVNDRYGHAAGDAVLVRLGELLTRTFPRKGDCVARVGGEEFGIVLRDATQRDGETLGERLRECVAATEVLHRGNLIRVTLSVGVAEVGRDETPAAWFERADRGLYAAKAAGRDRVHAAPAASDPSFIPSASG